MKFQKKRKKIVASEITVLLYQNYQKKNSIMKYEVAVV